MECLLMEVVGNVAVDNGGIEKDIGIVGAVEEGGGVIESAKGRVRALELEV